jgi:hypothetical protein
MALELLPALHGTPVTKLTPVNSDISLYAVWVPENTYVIIYDPNGGTFNTQIPAANRGSGKEPIARSVTYPDVKKLDQNGDQYSLYGYPGGIEDMTNGFAGWCDNTSGSGTRYDQHHGGGGQWEVQAEWTPKKSLVLYSCTWNN